MGGKKEGGPQDLHRNGLIWRREYVKVRVLIGTPLSGLPDNLCIMHKVVHNNNGACSDD